jgi:hypothetical protein
MKRLLLPVVGIASMLISPAAQAATVIWDLGSSINTYAQGASFTATTGSQTVNVFAEQLTDSGSAGGYGTIQTPEGGTGSGSTLCTGGNTTSGTCLFSVNATSGNIDSGIGPYAPVEGGSPYTGQQGISDDSAGYLTNADNVLYIELGSSIAAGSTVSFLLQAGDQGGATFTAYSSNTSSPFNLTSTTQINGTPIAIATSTSGDPNAAGTLTATNTSAAQLTITRDSAATQFIALQADCTYILLDQIAVTPATAPEPRFYGMLLAGLLAVAVTLRRRFVTA